MENLLGYWKLSVAVCHWSLEDRKDTDHNSEFNEMCGHHLHHHHRWEMLEKNGWKGLPEG